MGKGDKKTKRGKLFMGSHGRLNPKKRITPYQPVEKAAEAPKKKPAKTKKEE